MSNRVPVPVPSPVQGLPSPGPLAQGRSPGLRQPPHALRSRFAVISDLHVALPETMWDHPGRFHLVEVAIPALEQILDRLEQLSLDFVLLPGDLTQHGEPENHEWLADRLARLPFPVYVIPGNHDFPPRSNYPRITTLPEFVRLYEKFGYDDPSRPYYCHEIQPGIVLIGLNSNQVAPDGRDIVGVIDEEQLAWLDRTLAQLGDRFTIVMVHHNILEHLPGQATSRLGRRYILQNAAALRSRLVAAGVKLVFTGHLHIQDIAEADGLLDITTGSLVSYPHPFRIVTLETRDDGELWLEVESARVESVPGWDHLPDRSREWMAERSPPFMRRLLIDAAFDLSDEEIEAYLPELRYFWADIAQGDSLLAFPRLPPQVRAYCESFGARSSQGAIACQDNHIALRLT